LRWAGASPAVRTRGQASPRRVCEAGEGERAQGGGQGRQARHRLRLHVQGLQQRQLAQGLKVCR
jgi:hypothetical protein